MKIRFFARESFGGRHSFDLQIYYFLAPFAILVIPLIDSDFKSVENFIGWIFASTVGYSIQLILLNVAQRVLMQKPNFKPFHAWKIFVFGAFLGAMRGSVTFEIAQFIGLPNIHQHTLGLRTLVGAVAGLFWVPLLAVVSNNISEIRSRRNLMMENLLQQRYFLNENQTLLLDIKKVVRDEIENDVSGLLRKTQEEIENALGRDLNEQYEEISKVLIFAAEKLVRPLSHQLMEDNKIIFPSPKLRSILILAIKNPILPILPLLFLNQIAVLLILAPEVGSIFKLVLICNLQLAFTYLLIKLVLSVYKRFKGSRLQWAIGPQIFLSLFVLLKLNEFILEHLLGKKLYEFFGQRLFLDFGWLLFIMLFSSFIANIVNNETAIEAFVLQLIASDKLDELLVNEETLRVKHDIARYLHGNLQSRIMSLGLTLNMQTLRDQANMDSAISIASSLLNSPFQEYLDNQERSLADEVFYNSGKWDGLLEVNFQIGELTIILSAVQKRAIGSALEEALANALRHGFAKAVLINIFQEGSDVVVQVLDDGIGPRNSVAGLGSRLYDQIAIKGWSLQHRINEEGTVLELRL